ncbi:hypothetical protein GW17_00034299, partial [Ensete ventricosum]
ISSEPIAGRHISSPHGNEVAGRTAGASPPAVSWAYLQGPTKRRRRCGGHVLYMTRKDTFAVCNSARALSV